MSVLYNSILHGGYAMQAMQFIDILTTVRPTNIIMTVHSDFNKVFLKLMF